MGFSFEDTMKIQTAQYGQIHVLTQCPLLDSTERLEFKTEVHEAYNSNEERFILREEPRQILAFNYVGMRKSMGDMFHMLYANLRKTWGIPLKQLKQNMPDVASDFIQMDSFINASDLRIGFALVQTSTADSFVEIIEIGRYLVTQQEIRDQETDEILQEEIIEYQDGFRLSEPLVAVNATITPVRICIIDGDANFNTGGFWASQQVRFLVLAEDGPVNIESLPEQYKGNDIYFERMLLDGDSLDMSLTQHQVLVDAEIGRFTQFTDWQKPRYLKPFKSVLKNKTEFIEYRKFLFRRMGQYRAFWLPLYEKHLNVLSNTNSSVTVDNAYIVESDRKHLAIKINGIWTAHEITAKTAISLSFTPAISGKIESICYLGLHRFAADQIEFSFLGKGIVQTTVPILELSA